MVIMVWVVSRLRLKGPSWYLIFIYHHSHHWGNIAVPQPQKSATLSPQPGGKTTKFIRTSGGTGGRGDCGENELDMGHMQLSTFGGI